MKNFFGKKINLEFVLSKNFLFFILLLIEIFLFLFLYTKPTPNWLSDPYLYTRDAYSFYEYNYSSLENFFSQYRSFGGPLFVSIYKFFSPSLNNWGIVNFLVFSSSLLLLFIALCEYKVSSIFSFLFVLGILGQTKIWPQFNYFSEVLSLSLLIFSISLYIFSSIYKKTYLNILFALTLFLTYQTRPLLVVFIGFFIILELVILKFDKSKNIFSKESLKIILLTILPLVFFLILRFSVTGHVGIAPYVGAHIGSHALIHVENRNTNNSLEDSNKFLAKIIERRDKHKYPCNLNYKELKKLNLKDENYQTCYLYNTMSLLLEMISQLKNKKPFDEDNPKNYNSWEHVRTLDKFFMSINNYNDIDKELKKFAFEQIKINPKGYIEQFKISFLDSYKTIFKINSRLIYLYLFSLILLFLFSRFNKFDSNFRKSDVKIYALVSATLITNFVSFLLLNAIHLSQVRLIAIQGIFVIPMIFSFIVCLMSDKFNPKLN